MRVDSLLTPSIPVIVYYHENYIIIVGFLQAFTNCLVVFQCAISNSFRDSSTIGVAKHFLLFKFLLTFHSFPNSCNTSVATEPSNWEITIMIVRVAQTKPTRESPSRYAAVKKKGYDCNCLNPICSIN